MLKISVAKWQGTGNDFIVFDNPTGAAYPYDDLARRLCDRRFGIGADGLIVLLPAADSQAAAAMRLFNADGSEAEMCGNGARCVAKHLARERDRGAILIETPAGPISTQFVQRDGSTQVRVAMGRPHFRRNLIPMSGPPDEEVMDVPLDAAGQRFSMCAVSMGNPHAVLFAHGDPDEIGLAAVVAVADRRDIFPAGVNVEIARPSSGSAIAMRVWERGVGETWACGTGACAVAAAAIKTGRAKSPVTIASRGGAVEVAWDGADEPVYLTGQAERICTAQFEI